MDTWFYGVVALLLGQVLIVIGYLAGRRRRDKQPLVVFLKDKEPADKEALQSKPKESKQHRRPMRWLRWVLVGIVIGAFLQIGLLALLGVAPKFCELRGWRPPQSERQQEGGS